MSEQLYLVGTKTLTMQEAFTLVNPRCRECRRRRCKCTAWSTPADASGTQPEGSKDPSPPKPTG